MFVLKVSDFQISMHYRAEIVRDENVDADFFMFMIYYLMPMFAFLFHTHLCKVHIFLFFRQTVAEFSGETIL